MPEDKSTQRAYTLRLRGVDPNDQSWRDALWRTHEAVNNGAKAFGDWLLTMRGGLDHSLADTNDEKDLTLEKRKERRILLALSWLSVESKLGAPEKFIVASGQEEANVRNKKVLEALEEILRARGLADEEIRNWMSDCRDSLSAAIRDDAVWVNRSKAFDEACDGQDEQRARKDSKTVIWHLLGENYLKLLSKAKKKQSDQLDQEEEKPESDEDATKSDSSSSSGAGQRTRSLFGHIFGRESSNISSESDDLTLRNHWKNHLKPLIEATGILLRDPNSKARKNTDLAPTELHREMFSKAASRLAQIWTKQKQQELERGKRTEMNDELRKLENDQAYNTALQLLNTFCRERGRSSGSLEEYRINLRAIESWDRVVAAWEKIPETDNQVTEKRIEEAKRLQNDDADKKFGDINLFVSLAEKEYEPVWWHSGQATPYILKTYVKGWKARTDTVRLKVAAFRHPDPYFHPVFCQFGKSRPKIKYNRLNKEDKRKVEMLLWDGSKAKNTALLAVSKRVDKEIDSSNRLNSAPEVARRRLGIIPLAKIDKGWNGTLQADRWELEAIGRMESSDREEAKKSLRWWLTISLKLSLQQKGPWYDFIANSSDKTVFTQILKNGEYKVHEKVHETENKNRKGQARLILSRLPGLRVLSVDLGHRYAAACAVWEALTAEQVEEACRAAGREKPSEKDTYLHLKKKVKKQENGREVEVEETTIYRRIGADTLPDGTPHPAPWARLDRNFLIKLQGEEEGAREASNEEIWAVHQMETEIGRAAPLIDRLVASGWGSTKKQEARLEALKKLGWIPAESSGKEKENEADKPSLAVDELMFSAVRNMRLALKRHGDRARIAHYLITDEKTKPGGTKEKLDENGRVEIVLDALVMWRDLFSSLGWCDCAAKQLWYEHIVKLPGYRATEETGGSVSRQNHGKKQEEIRESLRSAAKTLANDPALREFLHEVWKKRCEEDDEWWKKRLRWFKDWILPRGKHANDPAIRKVGGLSLTRLATVTEFRRKVQVGFFTRLRPDGTKAEIKEQFGQGVLDSLEHLREQRVKQLASRIVEAALGIGSEGGKGWDGSKRPRQRISDPRFNPCHAVVIENLTYYRPEETRTRRENRQLMEWSSSKVKKYLSESCELHGLHLCEVPANYTSRQDSRTGAPGIRCQDVPVREFMCSRFWRKQVEEAEKQSEDKRDEREKFLCELNAVWKHKSMTDWKEAGTVRLPLQGGELFVSANHCSPAAKGLQADLNAAANIGLRALNDPDWPGTWWYVPCDPKTLIPVKDKVKGSKAVPNQPLSKFTQAQNGAETKGKNTGKSKQVVNLWRDISCEELTTRDKGWEIYGTYSERVQARVINILKDWNSRNKQLCDGSSPDTLPF